MKQDKAEKIIKKAELKAQKAAQQVQVAAKKAEITKQKQIAQAQKKAAKAANAAAKKAALKTKRAEAATKKAQLAAQKAEEKKAKAVAKVASKAAEGGEDGGEAPGGKPKKKGKKKLLMIAIPVVAVAVGAGAFFFLRGGGEEEELPPEPIAAPAEYVLEECHISALPVWGDVVVYQEEVLPLAEPEPSEEENSKQEDASKEGEDSKEEDASKEGEDSKEEGEDSGEEAAPAEEEVEVEPKTRYRYEGLQDPAGLVSAYAQLMTAPDAGFSLVDETLLRIEAPEELGSIGSLQLARNIPKAEDGTGGGVHSLLLQWQGSQCLVTLDTPEGMVHDPKPAKSGASSAPRRSLEDIKAMHPSKLGLAGESMEDYELMPQEGSVLIAGNPSPCMRINAYDANSQIAASFFLSGDGHLYKLDEEANAVMELDWE